jgi:hypothetical protein
MGAVKNKIDTKNTTANLAILIMSTPNFLIFAILLSDPDPFTSMRNLKYTAWFLMKNFSCFRLGRSSTSLFVINIMKPNITEVKNPIIITEDMASSNKIDPAIKKEKNH